MRFMLLTPGTGHFYCGSCLRDNTLAAALRQQGHEVEVVPLYLPMMLEDGQAEEPRVHMGGINMYLQQKVGLAKHAPDWLANLLDSPRLLRWASKRGNMTEAPDLGPMTVSMVRGEDGRQAGEVEKLVRWAKEQPRPDVLVISNAMLIGVVRRMKQELGCKVVTTLQGEQPFLDSLPEPHRSDAWDALRGRAADVDAFVGVSRWYGDRMRDRLGIDESRLHVVYNGIDVSLFGDPSALSDRSPRTIGYLARMCRDKGVDTLVDAFLRLRQRGGFDDVRLHVAGVQLNEDKPLVDELRSKIEAQHAMDAVTFSPNLERADKLAFLQTLSVLSVPAMYGESFGLYLLEALASGVPVVQPRDAAFPELLEATGGGVLCEPGDPEALADALADVLSDPARAQQLADSGRGVVRDRFTAARMAEQFEAVAARFAQG